MVPQLDKLEIGNLDILTQGAGLKLQRHSRGGWLCVLHHLQMHSIRALFDALSNQVAVLSVNEYMTSTSKEESSDILTDKQLLASIVATQDPETSAFRWFRYGDWLEANAPLSEVVVPENEAKVRAKVVSPRRSFAVR